MEALFISIYRFFRKSRTAFWLTFVIVLTLVGFGASQVDFEEDITKFFPDDKRVEKLSFIFENSAFADKVVMMVSIPDSSMKASPDSLVSFTERFSETLIPAIEPYNVSVKTQVDDQKMLGVFEIVKNNLPVLLNEDDYRKLDSISNPDTGRKILQDHYRKLLSPTGIALKKIITDDPLGFSFLVLKKMRDLQYDDNFELYENYIITTDHRHLLFFIQTSRGSGQIGKNKEFVQALTNVVNSANEKSGFVKVSPFGATIVAVGNSNVLRKDTILTMSLMIVLLAIFIIGFFRQKRVLFLILLPAAFGGLFSLSCIFVLKGSVSVLAMAAGSVILGIAVNYALHYLVHLRHHPEHEQTIRDLVTPMTLGSTTTVLAFFSLQFTNAAVLKDLGLFAGFSLVGASLFALIFLPHFIKPREWDYNKLERSTFLTRKVSPKIVWAILLATPVFLYFASDVRFNSDMGSLNFMEKDVKEAEQRLGTISPASLHAMYLASEGDNLEEALRKNEITISKIDSLKQRKVVAKYQAVSSFLMSDSLQHVRLERWKAFWTSERKAALTTAVHDEGQKLKFSMKVLNNLDAVLDKSYTVMDTGSFNTLKKIFFEGNVIEKNNKVTVVSMVNVMPGHKGDVYKAMDRQPTQAFDRQMITNLFVRYVHDDFNFIVTFTSLLVFVVLLISYGRIEITLITFIPMLITWIWILGIMALFGIEFNIINVIVSTFIFGLGDDYSIFVMDGLQQEYKNGKVVLPSVRVSILLSAVTTISGLGVLMFAEHPALRSIAAIAIIGIACVFIMSQTIEPFLFDLLVTSRTKRKLSPRTAGGMIYTFITYTLFVFGSFFLTILGLILKLIPFGKKHIKLFYHSLIRFFTWLTIYSAFHLRKKIIGRSSETFASSKIIIANHSSFLDILLTAMLHPKVILITNKWVYNSPVFGGVVRLADYYPVTEGAEESIDKLKQLASQGFSIVVFPEGTRSEDGKLQRFHKGAFYMAEKLGLPIQPLMILGAAESIPKGTMYVNNGQLLLKFLPPISPNDNRFGITYSERTKSISRYFKSEYYSLEKRELTAESQRFKLYSNFIYKGPILEWYMRVKVRLENYYTLFDELIPKDAHVLDLGCGYGFLCYMLQFLSADRRITGVDYDDQKIEVAQNGYLRSSELNFVAADITEFDWEPHDVIIISDVLHYLLPGQQQKLLDRCFRGLKPGGKIIIRDGNADLTKRHQGTKFTELLSVKLLRFNKSQNQLNFVSGSALTAFAQAHGLHVREIDHGKLTSNIIFVISKDKELHAAI